ncbi:MAG TPA: L,D-transpeptidase family protein [Bauldia sp.]|nr:L,D-transpeptidase family protein [Bauldia sp.]
MSASLRHILPILLLLLPPAIACAEDAPVPPEPIPDAGATAPLVLDPAATDPTLQPAPAAEPATNPAAPVDAFAKPPAPDAVNAAEFTGEPLPEGLSALTMKLQILLDEIGASPGVIDGINGRNVAKAIGAAEVMMGLPVDGILDAEVWRRLPKDTPILVGYTITDADVAGPFLGTVPTDYAEMAKLDSLAYANPLEMFGERFHMDVDLLKALNPGVDFGVAGSQIVVAAANTYAVLTKVARIVADKRNAQLLAYAADGTLVAAYPATIGSSELPSPSGTHLVNGVARNAAYYYRPKVNFQQGNNTERLTIPPGPNNPIGTTWIDLSEPTYGIHGTPEPSRIDKTNSHGCVRLTNWDVEELANLVHFGVPVEFIE